MEQVKLTRAMIQRATKDSPWSLGNQILYKLCKKYPKHRKREEIVAKIWLIGRAYSASIERRKNKKEINDSFYTQKVFRALRQSESKLDTYLHKIKHIKYADKTSLLPIAETHKKLQILFQKITELEKRSLASKYLHFHFPNLFFIYDSRSLMAIKALKFDRSNKPSLCPTGKFDKKYLDFAEHCVELRDYVQETYRIKLTPRQIDNILIQVANSLA